MAPPKRCCSACRWWEFQRAPENEDSASENAIGYCRRLPPARRENGVGAWPITIAYDWCGEFDGQVAVMPATSQGVH